jgi:hypothetical protein
VGLFKRKQKIHGSLPKGFSAPKKTKKGSPKIYREHEDWTGSDSSTRDTVGPQGDDTGFSDQYYIDWHKKQISEYGKILSELDVQLRQVIKNNKSSFGASQMLDVLNNYQTGTLEDLALHDMSDGIIKEIFQEIETVRNEQKDLEKKLAILIGYKDIDKRSKLVSSSSHGSLPKGFSAPKKTKKVPPKIVKPEEKVKEKIDFSTKSEKIKDDEAIQIIKIRLAKGEITLEEFEKLKSVL